MPLVLLAFLIVPLIEIALFIWIGGMIGIGWTLIAIIATAALGIVVIRHQGRGLVAQARDQIQAREKPVRPVFEGLCLVIAAVFLMTPGFFTDALGFFLLLPPIRAWLGYHWWEWSRRRGGVHVHMAGGGPRHGPHDQRGGPTVDGEAEEVDPDRPDRADDPRLPPVDRSRWGGRER